MQRLEQASRNVILLLFLIKTTVDAYMPVFALIALVAYSVSLALIIPGLLQKNSGWRRMAILSAVIALISHAFALINLALATFMPNEFITHLEATPGMLVHIGLSLFAYATLIIAALYAMQLAWIDYQLKNKKLAFNHEMPPLMVIERKMFHITQVGVVLLTLTLCTGLFYMKNLFSVENIDKAVLSIIAWFVYIVLLWGHYHEGWRGRRVVWFNVAGAGILTLAYFGSRFIQQFAG